MDIHCASCNEPWDTHHLRHDAVHDTPAGIDWVEYALDIEDWVKEMNRAGYYVSVEDDVPVRVVEMQQELFNLSVKPRPKRPPPPHKEKWERKLTPFWREQFQQAGWTFGTSVVAVLRCPCCKDNEEHDDAKTRRMLGGSCPTH